MSEQHPLLHLSQVECRYGDQVIVEDINFSLKHGDSACLLGASGCGKTTLLRAIAGLEPIYNGSISIHGKICSTAKQILPPEQRDLGLVFQDHALFPHLSIFDNVAFGLRKIKRKDKVARVKECLELVGLKDMAQRYPHQLSGGQQQRVALARTIAPKPKLVLLDEPFSSLDTHLRRSLARELKEVLADQGIAHLLVTHDQQEAFAMSDYIGVMHEGKLLQWDSPYNLYHKPQDAQIAAFVGEGYFIAGKVCDQNDTVSTVLGNFNIANGKHFEPNQDVLVLMRPDDLKPNQDSKHRAKVSHKVFKGAIIEYELELANKERLKAVFPSHHDYALTQDIGFDLDIQHLIVYPNLMKL